MITSVIAFMISLGLAALATPLVRNLALSRGWVDRALSSRKIHKQPVPRLGGVAIVASFYAPLVGLLLVNSGVGAFFFADLRLPVGIFLGGLLMAAVGLLDDLRGLGAAKKFSAQFLIAAIMFSLGFGIEKVTTPWGSLPLGAFSLPFTMVWIVGVVNAMNLIDGLDGLASGVAFVAVATNFVIAAVNSNPLMMLFMAAMAGAILGFLIYNFNPASIFMGDTGSMFLGFILATSSLVTSSKSTATVAMLVPILALGLPIMDTFLAMFRRAIRGQPLFAADREHVHHKLLALGLSQRTAVIVLYGICVLFAVAALGATFANGRQTAIILVAIGSMVVVFMRKLGYFSHVAEDFSGRREHNLAIREQVGEIGKLLQAAAAPVNAWEAVQPLASSMAVTEMSLTLIATPPANPRQTSEFSWKADAGTENEPVEVRLPIESDGECLGEIRVAWRDGRTMISRDDEIALETLRDHMVSAAKKMARKPAASLVFPAERKDS